MALASDPLATNRIQSARVPSASATRSRACSSAERASAPRRYGLDGLPIGAAINSSIRARTAGIRNVVALLSR